MKLKSLLAPLAFYSMVSCALPCDHDKTDAKSVKKCKETVQKYTEKVTACMSRIGQTDIVPGKKCRTLGRMGGSTISMACVSEKDNSLDISVLQHEVPREIVYHSTDGESFDCAVFGKKDSGVQFNGRQMNDATRAILRTSARNIVPPPCTLESNKHLGAEFVEKSKGLEKVASCYPASVCLTPDEYLYLTLKDFHDQCFASAGRPCREKDGKVECETGVRN